MRPPPPPRTHRWTEHTTDRQHAAAEFCLATGIKSTSISVARRPSARGPGGVRLSAAHHAAARRRRRGRGELLPSKLCEYIFELAGRFNQFYEALSVVNAETEEARRSRLALCALTAATLRLNLELLGIEPLERL